MSFLRNLYEKIASKYIRHVDKEKKRTNLARTTYIEMQINGLERDYGRILEHLEENPWGIEALAEFSSPSPYKSPSVRKNMLRDHTIAHQSILTNLKHYRTSVDPETLHAYFSAWEYFENSYADLEDRFSDSDRQL